MHNEIAPVVLGSIGAAFGGYGIRELTLAYQVVALKEWSERAVIGTASVFLAAVFGVMTLTQFS